MLILPPEIMTVLMPFTQAFSARVWNWAQTLLVGAILAPGKRTVTAALRVLGLKDNRPYQNYHRVINRANATLLLKENVHPKIVQEMLGHSSITLTFDTYSSSMTHFCSE